MSTKERTERAANRVATEYLTKLGMSAPSMSRNKRTPTLREFTTEFLEWAEMTSTIEPNTKKYYGYGVRLLLFSPLSSIPIDQIDSKLIGITKFRRPVINRQTGEYTSEWVDCGKTYSQQAQRTLRVALGKAVEWNLLQTRVSFKIAKTPGRDGIISPEVEQVILHELSGCRSKRPWLVLITLMDTGCRPSEAFEMRLENIDWAGRRILIPDGKTENSKRWVGMTERMHKELSSWCRGSEKPGWLFPARTNGSKHGHLNSIASSFKAACIRAGLDPKIVPYLARHTFGTTAMERTGNVFQVMKAMGHASVLSMAPYQHQQTAQLTDVMNKRNDAASRT